MTSATTDYEALIVGGGAAGLSAALVLGRARVRTLLVDAGEQSNLAADAVGGLLGQDRTAPADLYAQGRRQLAELSSVTVQDGRVLTLSGAAAPAGSGFTAGLQDGATLTTSRVLLATGMRYERPDLPGLEQLWGGAAFHCPYCHGWEHRDGRLAVLGAANVVHRALLLRSWSADVVVLAHDLPEADRAALAAAGIPVDERPVAALHAEGPKLRAVSFADGSELERDGVVVPVHLRPRDDLAARLGCAAADTPLASGALVVDPERRTSVAGVFAAGDASVGVPQIAPAIAAGSEAAGALHRSLVMA